MTEIPPPEPPTTASPAPVRRFLRDPDDRVLGGVAGGLGRQFAVDPLVFRIAFGVLVLVGGAGVLAYLAAWLLVPADDGSGRPVPRDATWRGAATLAGGVLLGVAALAILGDTDVLGDAGWIVGLGAAVGLVYALVHASRDGTLRTPGSSRLDLRRLLVLTTIGLTAFVGLFFAFWGAAYATAEGGGAVVAGIVVVLGVLLVAAALGGRRLRWLALPALVLALPVGIVSAADFSLDGGFGERTHRPAGADVVPPAYRLGVGELVVDLRDLDWRNGRREAIAVDMGVGHVVVYVPEEVCVTARSHVGAGVSDVLGRTFEGSDIDGDVERRPAPGVPVLAIDAEVGLGAFEVRHGEDGLERVRRPGQRRFEMEFRERDEDDDRIADAACAGATA